MDTSQRRRVRSRSALARLPFAAAMIAAVAIAAAQEPAAWQPEPIFHTFSIVAIDPATGESGVAVTTRRPCVGNAVPWVRAGVGAVATQARTRIEYGTELLDLLAAGVEPQAALDRLLAADDEREHRQIGVIDLEGRTAQWTGAEQYGEEARGDWVAMRAGENYAVQGNALVGEHVVDAVAGAFEASDGLPRHLADRLIAALAAGQALGGDGRHGELQSAAVLVADPRPGRSRRPDSVSVDINVCEHAAPVLELRRVYDTISETLGYRELRQFHGKDVLQLKLMLTALGYLEPDPALLLPDDPASLVYDPATIAAVDRFRTEQGWATPVAGFVDESTVQALWARLDEAGRAEDIRLQLLDIARVTR